MPGQVRVHESVPDGLRPVEEGPCGGDAPLGDVPPPFAVMPTGPYCRLEGHPEGSKPVTFAPAQSGLHAVALHEAVALPRVAFFPCTGAA